MADTAPTLPRDRGPSVDDLVALVDWDVSCGDETAWSLVAHAPHRHMSLARRATNLAWRADALAGLSPRSDKAHLVEFRARDLEHTCAGLEREFTFRVGLLVGRWAEQNPTTSRLDPDTFDVMVAQAADSAERSQWGDFTRCGIDSVQEAIDELGGSWILAFSGAFWHLERSDLLALLDKTTDALGEKSAIERMAQIRACADI